MNEAIFYGGMHIRPSPYVPATKPRIQLNPSVPVSDEFRKEMNAWLEEFFGHVSVAYILDSSMLAIDPYGASLSMILNDAVFASLKATIK